MRLEYRRAETGLMMEIDYPENYKKGDSFPSIFWVYGGGWLKGNIEMLDAYCERYLKQGYIFIRPQYRVGYINNTNVSDCVEDVVKAFRYLLDNAENLGVDTTRLIGAGISAGGHLAAMLECGDYGFSGTFKAMMFYSPVLDTSPEGYENKRVGSSWREISPLHNFKNSFPPFMICAADTDQAVPFKGTEEFCKKAEKAGIKHMLKIFHGENHGLSLNPESQPRMMEYFDEFLRNMKI